MSAAAAAALPAYREQTHPQFLHLCKLSSSFPALALPTLGSANSGTRHDTLGAGRRSGARAVEVC